MKAFTYPLGGSRWLTAEHRSPGWFFSPGGEMTAHQWPEVVARGLSRLPRWGGQTPRSYSVGMHSLLMAEYLQTQYKATPGAQMLALWHDGAECLGAGDMNRWLKRIVDSSIYRGYEDGVVDFLLRETDVRKFINTSDEELVHAVDVQFGTVEARLMDMQAGQGDWDKAYPGSGAGNAIYDFLRNRMYQGSIDEDYSVITGHRWLALWTTLTQELRA